MTPPHGPPRPSIKEMTSEADSNRTGTAKAPNVFHLFYGAFFLLLFCFQMIISREIEESNRIISSSKEEEEED